MESDSENYQKISRFGAVALKVVLVLFGVLIAYFVLLPLGARIFFRIGWLKPDHYPFIEAIDQPITWLFNNCEPYAKLLNFFNELILK